MAALKYISFLLLAVSITTSYGIHTVPGIVIESYTVRWYQVYTNVAADLFTGRDPRPECGTADYTLVNSTYVNVYNANCRLDEEYTDGIDGYGFIPDISFPGRLKVVLGGAPVPSDYWVFKLGPLVEGMYQYSLVTDDGNTDVLYVLSRDPLEFYELYEKEVLEYVALNGFTGPIKSPYVVPHPPECRYPPNPFE